MFCLFYYSMKKPRPNGVIPSRGLVHVLWLDKRIYIRETQLIKGKQGPTTTLPLLLVNPTSDQLKALRPFRLMPIEK